jgi:hypothetical protein
MECSKHINSLKTYFQVHHGNRYWQLNSVFGLVDNQEIISLVTTNTRARRYLNCQSNHPPHVKRGVVQSLYHSGTAICQEQQVRSDEIVTLQHALQLNVSPIGFIISVSKKSRRSIPLKNELQPLGLMSVPHIRGFSATCKRISNRCT